MEEIRQNFRSVVEAEGGVSSGRAALLSAAGEDVAFSGTPGAAKAKILFRIRSDIEAFPGGDYVHLLKTLRVLEQLGMEGAIAPGLEPMPEADAVHLFNATRIHETYLQYQEARRRGVPVIFTPIWHSMREMGRFYSSLYRVPGFPVWPYMAVKELYYARRSRLRPYWPATLRYRQLQREVVGGADLVIVSSEAELRIMEEELQVKARLARVVAPPFEAWPAHRQEEPGAPGPRRDLICAGRIEPRKNQLAIIRAFKSLGRGEHRLLLFGTMSSSHPGYSKAVRRELVPGWVEYRGQVSVEALGLAYRSARAGILASFFETCGFTAMEAMAHGAHAVVSDTPYTREIYGSHAAFCDPYSDRSIAEAIAGVLSQAKLDYRAFLTPYSWPHVIQRTKEAYACVIR